VKKIIAISFVVIFLCANTEIGQLLKLPNLIHHFIEHHDHDDNDHDDDHAISFLDFVKNHYNDSHKHSDTDQHDHHQNLPFKTINTNANTFISFEYQPVVSFRKPINLVVNNTVPFSQNFYISSVFASIWLPPKLS
jgi:hypothetical protein